MLQNKAINSRYKYNSYKLMVETEPKLSYPFATDTQYKNDDGKMVGCSKYINFGSLSEVIQILDKDQHLYEIITRNTCKMYFDIDNILLTRKEANKLLVAFLNILNRELKTKMDMTDLTIKCNEERSKKTGLFCDKFHSFHIILHKYRMEKTQQKHLAEIISDQLTDCDLDTSIYSKNRQFRAIGQSKNKPNKHHIRSIDFYEATINAEYIKNSLVNRVINTQNLEYKKVFNPIEYFEVEKPNIQLSATKAINLLLSSKPTAIITPSKRQELFNSYNWKTLTMIIKKTNVKNKEDGEAVICDSNEWLKQSVKIANNNKYTIQDNREYYDAIDVEEVFSGLTKMYNIISKYSSHNIYSDDCILPTSIISAFNSLLDEDEKNQAVKQYISYHFNNKKYEHITEKYIFNFQDGFYCDKDKKLLGNIFYDFIDCKTETLFTPLNTIDDAKTKAIEFYNHKHLKLMILKSKWGTGKTSNIINNLIENARKSNNKRILLITESRALASKLAHDYNFTNYMNVKKKSSIDNLYKHDKVVCSIQSIARLEKAKPFGLIVIDEIQSVFTSFNNSSTFKHSRLSNNGAYIFILKLINNAKKTLMCDADIMEEYVRLMEKEFNNQIIVYKNEQRAFEDYIFNLWIDCDTFQEDIMAKLSAGERVVVASASRMCIEKLQQYLVAKNIFVKTLTITRDGALIYENGVCIHTYSDDCDKQKIIQDLDKYITDNNIQLFAYSPTIKTGISFNSVYFDCVYAYSCNRSIVYCEYIQMLFRVRKLKQKRVNILLVKKSLQINQSIHQTENKMLKDLYVYQSLTKNNASVSKCECDDRFYELQIVNNNILYNTIHNYNYNILYLLKYHNLKIEYEITTDTIETEQEKIERLKEQKDNKLYEAEVAKMCWNKLELLNDDVINIIDKIKIIDEKYQYLNDNHLTDKYEKTKTLKACLKIKNINDMSVMNYINDICERTDLYYIIEDLKKDIYPLRHIFKDDTSILTYNYDTDGKLAVSNESVKFICDLFGIINTNYNPITKTNDIIFTKQTITNKQFYKLLNDNYDTINKMFQNYKNTKMKYDNKNNSHNKIIYTIFKKLLKERCFIDIGFVNKSNTTRLSDKFSFEPTKYQYLTYNIHSKTMDDFKDETTNIVKDIHSIDTKELFDDDAVRENNFTIFKKTKDRVVMKKIFNILRGKPNDKINKKLLSKNILTEKNINYSQNQIKSMELNDNELMMIYRVSLDELHALSMLYNQHKIHGKINSKIVMNTSYYNNALEMKLIGDKILYNGKEYKIEIYKTKKKMNETYININKNKRTKLEIYLNEYNGVRPYKSKEIIMKTDCDNINTVRKKLINDLNDKFEKSLIIV